MRAWRMFGGTGRWLGRPTGGGRSGQALIEFSLLVVVLALPTAIAAAGFVAIKATLDIGPVAREAARAMAEAPSAPAALAIGQARAAAVAEQARLRPERLSVAVAAGAFARESGPVTVTVRYRVDMQGIPLLGLPDPVVARTARWPVQRYQDR